MEFELRQAAVLMRAIDHVEALASTLPQKIKAARLNNLATLRITVEEAEAIRPLLTAAIRPRD